MHVTVHFFVATRRVGTKFSAFEAIYYREIQNKCEIGLGGPRSQISQVFKYLEIDALTIALIGQC